MKTFGTYDGEPFDELPVSLHRETIREFFQEELKDIMPFEDFGEMMHDYNRYMGRSARKFDSRYYKKLAQTDREKVRREVAQEYKKLFNWMGKREAAFVGYSNVEEGAQFLEMIADSVEEDDRVIVDNGCGSGLHMTALARLFPDKRFIGIDISDVLIDIAKELADKYALSNCEFLAMDRADAPFEDNSVDVLYIKSGLAEVSLAPFLEEEKNEDGVALDLIESTVRNYRMLKPGGVLLTFQHVHGKIGRETPHFTYESSVYLGDPRHDFNVSICYRK